MSFMNEATTSARSNFSSFAPSAPELFSSEYLSIVTAKPPAAASTETCRGESTAPAVLTGVVAAAVIEVVSSKEPLLPPLEELLRIQADDDPSALPSLAIEARGGKVGEMDPLLRCRT